MVGKPSLGKGCGARSPHEAVVRHGLEPGHDARQPETKTRGESQWVQCNPLSGLTVANTFTFTFASWFLYRIHPAPRLALPLPGEGRVSGRLVGQQLPVGALVTHVGHVGPTDARRPRLAAVQAPHQVHGRGLELRLGGERVEAHEAGGAVHLLGGLVPVTGRGRGRL